MLLNARSLAQYLDISAATVTHYGTWRNLVGDTPQLDLGWSSLSNLKVTSFHDYSEWEISLPDFQALFQEYVSNSVQAVLEQMEPGSDTPLNDKERERALYVLKYALNDVQTWEHTSALLLRMAPKMEMAGYRDEWIAYLQLGIEQSEKLCDLESQGELSIQTGYLYYLRGNYDAATRCFETGLRAFSANDSPSGQGICQNRLAMVSVQQGRYEEARHRVNMALQLLDSKEIDCANSYYVLGEVARLKHAWSESEGYFKRALTIWETHGDKRRSAWGLRNMGATLRKQGRYEEAIICYEKALNLFQYIQDPVNKASTQMNLGNILWETDCLSEALELYEAAKKIFLEVQDDLKIARIYTNIALCYHAMGKYEETEYYFSRSIDLWENLNHIPSLCNVLECLSLTYLQQGKFCKARLTIQKALSYMSQIEDGPAKNKLHTALMKNLNKAIGLEETLTFSNPIKGTSAK
ncbi:MAG: tetratricopeptide repeat protein [Caldilineaceae bacterium]|nr:tetratricopeptide repeat protein [Caldilineaceae bacterium]